MGNPGRPQKGNWFISVRDKELRWFHDVAGESYSQLSRRFGITPQRVEQILNNRDRQRREKREQERLEKGW